LGEADTEPAARAPGLGEELWPVLDREVAGLSDKFRAVVVLCDLEGLTRREAARRLGVPEGTVAGWLARARAQLAQRLARRGVTLAAALTPAAPPPALVDAAVRGVVATVSGSTQFVAARAAALTQGVLTAMLATKLKATVVALVLGAA